LTVSGLYQTLNTYPYTTLAPYPILSPTTPSSL